MDAVKPGTNVVIWETSDRVCWQVLPASGPSVQLAICKTEAEAREAAKRLKCVVIGTCRVS